MILVQAKILASTKSSLSDRHIVEKNFNDLDTYRADILPDVEGWHDLSQSKPHFQR